MIRIVKLKVIYVILAIVCSSSSWLNADNLAKKSQNPVGDIVSLPVEMHHYDGMADGKASMNALFIKPVYPVKVGNFNLINRAIIPVVSLDANAGNNDFGPIQPPLNFDAERGLGNIQYQGFFSPQEAGKVIWGVGPVVEVPTHQNDLGSDQWSAGVSAVALAMPGNWVVGGLVQNIWSITDKDHASDINKFTFQYFINYNLNNGWYLTTTPINTANWEKDGSDRWTIPIGGGVGRLVRFGKQPVDFKLQAFGYAQRPEDGPQWNMQFMVKFLFPK